MWSSIFHIPAPTSPEDPGIMTTVVRTLWEGGGDKEGKKIEGMSTQRLGKHSGTGRPFGFLLKETLYFFN